MKTDDAHFYRQILDPGLLSCVRNASAAGKVIPGRWGGTNKAHLAWDGARQPSKMWRWPTLLTEQSHEK